MCRPTWRYRLLYRARTAPCPRPGSATEDDLVLRYATIADLGATAQLHVEQLPAGFFPGLGPRFMRRWHRTYLDSPHGADACLAEEAVADLRNCIRTNLDCADVCVATASVLSRRTGSNLTVVTELLKACRAACATCAEDREAHADMHEHCKLCADACRRCEKACSDLLSAIG